MNAEQKTDALEALNAARPNLALVVEEQEQTAHLNSRQNFHDGRVR